MPPKGGSEIYSVRAKNGQLYWFQRGVPGRIKAPTTPKSATVHPASLHPSSGSERKTERKEEKKREILTPFAISTVVLHGKQEKQIQTMLKECFGRSVPLYGIQFFLLRSDMEMVSCMQLADEKGESWLYNVCTPARFARRGYARYLLRYLLMWWNMSRFPSPLHLDVWEDNKAAIQLYTQEGFRVVLKKREMDKSTRQLRNVLIMTYS